MEAEITQDELKALVRYDPDTGCFHHLIARKNVRAGRCGWRFRYGGLYPPETER